MYKSIKELYTNDESHADVNNTSRTSITYKTYIGDMQNPKVWGPSFWFSLQMGSLNFPENASKIVADKMKGFILGIPYMLPCDSCSEHARAYIQTNYDNLDEICLGRKTLVNFFYNFHNFVNKRLGKPQLSFEEAMNLYRGSVTVISSIQKV